MKNNKLTLKALKAELDQIKKSKAKSTSPSQDTSTQDIKHSYIQNLHMKSSMFMLWIVTAILSYGNKIPFIKQIVSFLSLWYGRTTFWKLLIKLRKVFIIFNALIGVFMVFSTVGFSYDNILAGFVGMGNNYLEIFTNFTKRLFHWFVELFDHKVVPNVPGNNSSIFGNSTGNNVIKGGYNGIWTPSNKYYPTPNVETSLRDSYKSLLNISVEPTPSSWYNNFSTWIWVGGSICLVYFGYKFISDPSFISELWNKYVAGAESSAPAITVVPASSPDGAINSEGSIVYIVTKSIVNKVKFLNPVYWFITPVDYKAELISFNTKQATFDRLEKFYPYTHVNPYDSWLKRMRVSWLGETTAEMLNREALARDYLTAMTEHVRPAAESVASGSNISLTPNVATVGLGLHFDQSFLSTAEKIFSVPSTPGLKPLAHLVTEELNSQWDTEGFNSLKGLPNTEELDDVVEGVASPVGSYI